jgi:hypothetical protein
MDRRCWQVKMNDVENEEVDEPKLKSRVGSPLE